MWLGMTYGDKLSFHIVLNGPYFFSRVCPRAGKRDDMLINPAEDRALRSGQVH
jgi:hypothetical protein